MNNDTGVTEMKKRSIVLLFLLIGFAIITTTYAFNITTVSDAVDFVESPRTDSDRGVSSYEAYPLGKNAVYVKFTLGADQTDVHDYVRVRVMPLDGSNNVLIADADGATIQRKIDLGSWDLSAQTITIDNEIISDYTSAYQNPDPIIIYIKFVEENIASTFTTCMIEVSEYT